MKGPWPKASQKTPLLVGQGYPELINPRNGGWIRYVFGPCSHTEPKLTGCLEVWKGNGDMGICKKWVTVVFFPAYRDYNSTYSW